jgi:hypothetical protein
MGLAMTDPVFQQAYETVRHSFTGEAWGALTPQQIAEAIYQEIRRIDAKMTGTGGPVLPTPAAAAG